MQSTYGPSNEHLYTAPRLDGESLQKESGKGLLEMPKAQGSLRCDANLSAMQQLMLGDFTSQQHKRVDGSQSLELLAVSVTSSTPPIEATSVGDATPPTSPTFEELYPNGQRQKEGELFHSWSIHSNDQSTKLSSNQSHSESDGPTSFGTDMNREAVEPTAPLFTDTGCWEQAQSTETPSKDELSLHSHGCYKIPSAPFLKIFIDHYFLYVHPMLPVLNEGDFWELHFSQAQTNSHTHYPSILLLQSILFAACPFVAEDHVKRLGFEDVCQAKDSFYKRAKLLYYAQDPLDHVLMAQSALLLTHRSSSIGHGEQKANSIWLGRAIQHAKILKVDQCTSPSMQSQNALRRIWFSCILRDRILSLCLRRNLQISQACLDRHADYAISYDDFSDEIQRSRVYDAESKQSLVTMMLSMADLCVCLSNILTVAQSVRTLTGPQSHGSSRKTMQIWECKKDLETWFMKAVSSSPVLTSTQPGHRQGDRPKVYILMFGHLVWVYYNSSRITLCNSELHLNAASYSLFQCGSARLPSTTIERTRVELWDAATNISERLGQLLKFGLARHLPGSAVSCTALPLALHVLDAKLSAADDCKSTDGRIEKQNHLNMLIDVMREYRARHEEADCVTRAIRYFMECTYLEPTPPSYTITGGSQSPGTSDVITQNPTQYLKLSLTLDLSLSQDRLPVEKDFPAQLQRLISSTGCFMPILFSYGGQASVSLAATSTEHPSSELEQNNVLCASPKGSDLTGWIQNDRSLFFAQEMGLGP
ncbi:Fungal-trans domain-containing protein [Fusarium sp. LHS14.1]|nr:Fungal-trans domain-containing protein [Fusarium sp. LHS14.1]